MSKEEALKKLKYLYHKTRTTKDIYIPSEIISAILYGEGNKIKYYEDRPYDRKTDDGGY